MTMRYARHMPHARCQRPLRRNGSVYAMVLAISMLITVIGIGALATARVTSRAAAGSNDWAEAGVTAFSAAEHAVARLNREAEASPRTWRDGYTSGAVAFSGTFGRGTMKWVLVDGKGLPADDGDLDDDYADVITLYGVGRIGSTTRVYSVTLDPAGGGLDVLRCPIHTADGLVLNGILYATGGPVSTNGTYSTTSDSNLRGALTGAGTNKEVADSSGSGSGSPRKRMPSAGAFDTYKAKATTIASTNAGGGTLQPWTLSAANNPYGDENPDGIYYLQLPDSVSTVTILSSYIKGTLLVEGAAGMNQTLVIDAPTSWEPHNAGLAILLTRGVRNVKIKGSIDALNHEAGLLQSELNGVIHLSGTATVELQAPAFIRGSLIADGVATITAAAGTAVGATANPTLLTNPPLGYTKGTKVIPSPGGWDWAAPPAAVAD